MAEATGRGVLVHEWVAQSGGSENVFEALSEVFPDADLRCLWNDSVGRFQGRRVEETWLARTPLRRSKAAALPFMPATWRRLEDRGYEWALISSHLFAHHARFGGRTNLPRFVYVHSPARYIWAPELDARGSHPVARLVGSAFKPIDRRAARAGSTSYAANSEFVRARVRQAWGVDARVIFPPVDVEQIQSVATWADWLSAEEQLVLDALPDGFVLGASRFIPYKRLDLVIRTGELVGRPVVLAGRGPELDRLREVARGASVPVHFVDAPSGAMLRALYQATALYVFPAVEDFGIMPVEALAAGAPVLTQRVGGTSESVQSGISGALVTFDDAAEIVEGVEVALGTDREVRRARAREFSRERFERRVLGWVGER